MKFEYSSFRFRRFFALMLALIMTFSVFTPAYAAAGEDPEQETEAKPVAEEVISGAEEKDKAEGEEPAAEEELPAGTEPVRENEEIPETVPEVTDMEPDEKDADGDTDAGNGDADESIDAEVSGKEDLSVIEQPMMLMMFGAAPSGPDTGEIEALVSEFESSYIPDQTSYTIDSWEEAYRKYAPIKYAIEQNTLSLETQSKIDVMCLEFQEAIDALAFEFAPLEVGESFYTDGSFRNPSLDSTGKTYKFTVLTVGDDSTNGTVKVFLANGDPVGSVTLPASVSYSSVAAFDIYLVPGTEVNPWKVGKTNEGDILAWIDGSNVLHLSGSGEMKDFASDTGAPWKDKTVSGLDLSSSITHIGDYAFKDTALSGSISLPKVISIGSSAFENCTGITGVDLPKATSLGSSCFKGCSSLGSANVPVLTKVPERCFSGTALKNLDLVSVTGIGSYAFEDVSGLSLKIYYKGFLSFEGMDSNAFADCAPSVLLPSAWFSASNPVQWLKTGPNAYSYKFGGNPTYYSECYIIIDPDHEHGSVVADPETISDDETDYYKRMSDVTAIPDDGYELAEITVDPSGCLYSTSLVNPNQITVSVPRYTSVTVHVRFREVGVYGTESDPWYIGSPNEKDIKAYIKDGTLYITGTGSIMNFGDIKPWSSYRSKFTKAVISSGITGIGNNTFAYDTNLVEITVPDTVTSIGSSAFEYAEGLTSISLPNVTSIGGSAFNGCRSLTGGVSLPKITKIPDFAFCDAVLGSIEIPNVTEIGEAGFYCADLSNVSLELPRLTSIDRVAFSDTALKSLTVADISLLENTDEQAFYNYESHPATIVYIPSSWLKTYSLDELNEAGGDYQFKGKLNYVAMPDVTVADCENGSVSVTNSGPYIKLGETVTLSVTPDTGYVLSKLTFEPSAGGTATDITSDLSFEMPGYDVTVKAEFAHVHQWEYSASGSVVSAKCKINGCTDGYDTAPLTFTVYAPEKHGTASDLIYDGSPFPIVYESTDNSEFLEETGLIFDAGVCIAYYLEDSPDVLSTAPVNAGTYTALVNLKDKEGGFMNIGFPDSQYIDFTILKADQVITTGEDVTMTLGETGKKVTASVATGGGTISYTVSPATGLSVDAEGNLSATAAGSYVVTAKASASNNYKETVCTDTITVTVEKKTRAVSCDDALEAVYGDTGKKITASITEGSGTLSYAVTGASGIVTVDAGGNVAVLKPGETKITVTASETADYKSCTKDVTVTVAKAAITLKADDKSIYEKGTAPEFTYTVSSGSLVGSDKIPDSFKPSCPTLDSTVPGTYAITMSKDDLGDDFNALYEVTLTDGVLKVNEKKTQTVTASVPESIYILDNTKKVTASAEGTLSYAVTSGDAVSVDPSTGAVSALKAGEAVITVTAAETDEYKSATKDLTVKVALRTQKVTADNMTVVSSDSGAKLSFIVSEVPIDGVPALENKTAKPVFTSSDPSVASVDENGVITVLKSGTVTISMTLPANDCYAEVTVPVKMVLTVDPLKVIEGSGATYTVGSKTGLTFRANGVFDNFVGVQVDGKDVAASNYEAWSGSTYVRFTTKYLDKLSAGLHKLTYIYKNTSCDCYFRVYRSSNINPTTGDDANIALWASLFLLSAGGLSAAVIIRRKRRSSANR